MSYGDIHMPPSLAIFIGKKCSGVTQEEGTTPEGEQYDGPVTVHFTDGSNLKVWGSWTNNDTDMTSWEIIESRKVRKARADQTRKILDAFREGYDRALEHQVDLTPERFIQDRFGDEE